MILAFQDRLCSWLIWFPSVNPVNRDGTGKRETRVEHGIGPQNVLMQLAQFRSGFNSEPRTRDLPPQHRDLVPSPRP
jgi:hypothetical protein